MISVNSLNTTLADRYRIERELGRGGMATVYLARDVRHHRQVAVKVLNPELAAVLGVDRFLSEIRVTANLQHPNLLPLFDSGEAAGLLFYVMPFVEGESLRHRLDRERQLPVDDAVRIAVSVANALDYAHRHGVIHRDLKPENILLHDGQPLVADFGIALAVSNAGGSRITQTGLSLGTPQYMSPEQATGDRTIDARADIYALGAVLYEMLTGEPPHTGSTAQAIIARVLTEKPRPVRSSRPSAPEQVEAAVAQSLEKLPADRFPTAAALATALQNSGTTRSTTTARPPVFGVRRVAPVAVAMLMVGLALGYGVTRFLHLAATVAPTEYRGDVLGGPTSALAPRISPDGQTLAFAAMVNGLTEVAVLTPGTGSWRVLTRSNGRGFVTNLAWSRDGKRIYYDRFGAGVYGIYSIAATGSEERIVLEYGAVPDPLPDGSILFSWGNATRLTQLFRYWPESGKTDTLDALMGTGLSYMFYRAFPDGRRVAFYGRSSRDSTDHLRILDLSTGQSRTIAPGLTLTPAYWTFPISISPDQSEVIFGRRAGDLHQLVAVPSDGSPGIRTVIMLTDGTIGFDVGADGSVYVDHGTDPSSVVWYGGSRGNDRRVALPRAPWSGPAPLMLTDGRVLATVRSGGARVVVVSGNTPIVPFVDTPLETSGPLAQVGTDRVALVVGSAPNRKVALADRATGRIVRRIEGLNAERITGLAGSPDGKTLFHVLDGTVWALPLEGGIPKKLQAGDAVAVSPDGGHLVIQVAEKYYHVEWPSGSAREIVAKNDSLLPLASVSAASISRDGRILIRTCSRESWFCALGIVDQKAGTITPVGAPTEDVAPAGWSPEGLPVGQALGTLHSLWRFTPVGSRR